MSFSVMSDKSTNIVFPFWPGEVKGEEYEGVCAKVHTVFEEMHIPVADTRQM